MVHRLARSLYAMVTNGSSCVVRFWENLKERRRDLQKVDLLKLVQGLGHDVVPL